MEYYAIFSTYNTLKANLYKSFLFKGKTAHRSIATARKEAYESLMKMPYGESYIVAKGCDGIPRIAGVAKKRQSHVFSASWDKDFVEYKAKDSSNSYVLNKDGTLGRRL